ncbi:Uncharacterized protein encoded in hypervariable junctions of pilus gene clusters [Serratia fonticola]|uniref:Uncharacterized protein encoded in hypervariable junctions of pilus gene clusters n=1 Tax=Serratia fonticola TaxID=47917 RepID=A0A4U9UTV8_SERFO|nr:Uncharacterized protein encoded in hypervariable junctions of pilus gene clusters [Serratia fonticola]
MSASVRSFLLCHGWHLPAPQRLDGIEKLVRDVIADMLAQGETPPEALAEKNFSGKLVLRMTPEQHRRLAINAMDEGVSLNRYLCAPVGRIRAALRCPQGIA